MRENRLREQSEKQEETWERFNGELFWLQMLDWPRGQKIICSEMGKNPKVHSSCMYYFSMQIFTSMLYSCYRSLDTST